MSAMSIFMPSGTSSAAARSAAVLNEALRRLPEIPSVFTTRAIGRPSSMGSTAVSSGFRIAAQSPARRGRGHLEPSGFRRLLRNRWRRRGRQECSDGRGHLEPSRLSRKLRSRGGARTNGLRASALARLPGQAMHRGIKARSRHRRRSTGVEPAVRDRALAERAPPLFLEHQRAVDDAAGAGRSGGIPPE